MSAARRFKPGPWSQLWINLKKSLGLANQQRIVVGKDNYGNLYYQEEQPTRASRRGYIPSTERSYQKPHPLWEDWLRERRLEPPTPAEQDAFDRNWDQKLADYERIGSSAAQPSAIDAEPRKRVSGAAYPHVESDESKIVDDHAHYPQYKEYTVTPGLERDRTGVKDSTSKSSKK